MANATTASGTSVRGLTLASQEENERHVGSIAGEACSMARTSTQSARTLLQVETHCASSIPSSIVSIPTVPRSILINTPFL